MLTKARYSLTTKFAALFAIFAISIGILFCTVTYVNYRSSMLAHYGEHALGAAMLVASMLDSDEVLYYSKTLERDERYNVIETELEKIRRNLDIKYIYVLMPVNDSQCIYLIDIFDIEDDEGPGSTLWGLEGYDDSLNLAKHAMRTGKPTNKLEISRGVYGYLASAFVPILRKDSGIPFAFVGVDISMDDIQGFLMRYFVTMTSATTIVLIICSGILFFLVRHHVVSPILAIAEKAVEYTNRVNDENFEELRIYSNDEIGDLSVSVNTMFGEIRKFTLQLTEETARRERIQSELDMGKAIQEGILPKEFPPFFDFPDVAVFASMTPAKEVGGDFYDFFVVGENKLAIVIADVSGKGIPAALFMMVTRTLIKTRMLSGCNPQELLTIVNTQLCQNNDIGMFVTAFIGILDTKLDILKYVNAGHLPPILLRGDQAFKLLAEPNFVLGALENIDFVEQETVLVKDDLLLLYTDGVTEAVNKNSELFGNNRLIDLLSMKAKEAAETRGAISPEELIQTVSNAIRHYAGDIEQTDDITMLALRKIAE